jgi:glycosyltransferase involved in cell wall biosynthesis
MISIIIPVYNEEKNVKELHKEILEVCQKLNREFEIIFIYDCSSDKTLDELKKLSPIKIISFTRNFGQTAAFDAGFKAAQGDIIISMDGDLQNDPNDIPKFLEELNKGYDVVAGWRYPRKDGAGKHFVSFVARILRRILLGDKLRDAGCSLRVYRKNAIKNFDLYGEMHRFIAPILAARGFKVTEIKTNHRPRKFGKTKYNWLRGIKGFTDMLAVWFWQRYRSRPIHLFGGSGLVLFLIGFAIMLYFFIIRFFFHILIGGRIWPLVAVFLMLFGVQLFVTGLLADIAIRNYYSTSKDKSYFIKEIYDL